MHAVLASAGPDTLDIGKSETGLALACGEVWTMGQMASGQADTGPGENSGKVCCPNVAHGEPLACRARTLLRT